MNFKNYQELVNDVKEWAQKLPKDFDLIIGVPRSGILPAVILSLQMNLRLGELNSFAKNNYVFKTGVRFSKNSKISKILVVDDSLCFGGEMEKTKKILENKKDIDIKYGVIYCNPEKKHGVDFFCKLVERPRLYEWNAMTSKYLSNACIDLDGVLCIDPTEEENDDGKRYLNFISKTKPIFIPEIKLKYIVTCRLEKYRKQTEEWLKKYKIRYNKLIMMNYPDKATRLRMGNHAEFKAKFYLESDCDLFLESTIKQSRKIAKITKKPVLCFEDMKIY